MKTASVIPIAAAALVSASVHLRAQPSRDYTKFNVCEVVPGDRIAGAFGAKMLAARPTFDKNWSRCLYVVTNAGPDQQRGYIVWLSPAADFEEMKPYIAEKITAVAGLGDGAYIYQDKDNGRFKIYVLMRGDQTIQATGDTAASTRKVAEVVLAVLRK